MAWIRSLLSPLKKLWVRMHSDQNKSTCRQSSLSRFPVSSAFVLCCCSPITLQSIHPCSDMFSICCVVMMMMSREGHLHPVRGRQVVPLRGRADPLVHPRRVLPPAAAAAPQALTPSDHRPSAHVEHGAVTYRRATARASRSISRRLIVALVRPTQRNCRCMYIKIFQWFTFFSRDTIGG